MTSILKGQSAGMSEQIITLSTPSLAEAGRVEQLFAAHRARFGVEVPRAVREVIRYSHWSREDFCAVQAVEGRAPFPRAQAKRGA